MKYNKFGKQMIHLRLFLFINLMCVILFAITSCENSHDCTEDKAPIVELITPDSAEVNKEFNIKIAYLLSDGCKSFKRIEELRDKNNILLNLFIEKCYSPDYVCTLEIRYDTLNYNLKVDRIGDFLIIVNDTISSKSIIITK